MWRQVDKKSHLRHALLYEYNRGSGADQATQNINNTYGDDSISYRTTFMWFAKFRDGSFDLTDAPRAGRPSRINDDDLIELLDEDCRRTTRELAAELNTTHTSIINHLHSMGYHQKVGMWIPHNLTQINKNQRVTISASLLQRYQQATYQHRPFLSLIVTGDEKWVLYANFKTRKSWVRKGEKPQPNVRPDLHIKKIMLCVWWNVDGIVYWELLPHGSTINAEVYIAQLRKVDSAIKEKYPNLKHTIIFQHDNARPHVAQATKNTIEELGWEVLPHAPYSPDLAPSDFHLFLSLSNALVEKKFNDETELESWLGKWFDSKNQAFYRRGIENLLERWTEVINSGGEYIGT
jgi:[histone H3]-lysine36 N-dimethyltransferase SETMAR